MSTDYESPLEHSVNTVSGGCREDCPACEDERLHEAVSFTPEWEMRGLRISKERGPNASFVLECESKYPRVLVPVAFITYKPHAEFIVSAVNSHDALMSACKRLAKWADALEREAAPDRTAKSPPILEAEAAIRKGTS